MTVKELYDQSIKPLSTTDRYQLATMILSEIPVQAVVDYREEWSEEDLREFTRSSWARIESDPEYEHDG
jgi:protoheme ferro-lyase